MDEQYTDVDESLESPLSPEPAAPVATPAVPGVTTAETGLSNGAVGPDKSIADHAEAHADRVERDASGRFRNRAKSQQATAEDVPRIQNLTKRLRTVEEELQKERAAKAQSQARPSVPYSPAAPSVEFTDPEPQLEQFADKDDPYGAWQRELARWDRRKERADEQAQHMQALQAYTTREVSGYWEGVRSSHQQRLIAAAQSNPTAIQALQSVQVQPPPLLDWAIMLDKESASVALFLATHPTVLDEFALMTAAQPVTEQTVATTQRLLRQRMSAGTTGSVAPSQVLPNAPRPPNPVRTGLIRTGNEPPGPGSSIADHAKYYEPKARR